ncbi:MAG: hypothetical protein D6B27_07075 [Gammaproteobacteria bacterium]|nr:MAG: hypothetical protein D6B27_07075 [Gammaproteobacteria bacterium]
MWPFIGEIYYGLWFLLKKHTYGSQNSWIITTLFLKIINNKTRMLGLRSLAPTVNISSLPFTEQTNYALNQNWLLDNSLEKRLPN